MISTLKTHDYIELNEEQKEIWKLLNEAQIAWSVWSQFQKDLDNYAKLREEWLNGC